VFFQLVSFEMVLPLKVFTALGTAEGTFSFVSNALVRVTIPALPEHLTTVGAPTVFSSVTTLMPVARCGLPEGFFAHRATVGFHCVFESLVSV
jgi:hypothetical protein